MTLRADLTSLLAIAGIVDVDVDIAVKDEHVRVGAYLNVIAMVAVARSRDQDRAVVATILRDPRGSLSKTAVVDLVDRIAMRTTNPSDFQQWAAGLVPEIAKLRTDGHRTFLHRRIYDWTIYLNIKVGRTPTTAEMASVTDWMQRAIATESASVPVLSLLAEMGSTRKVRNLARTRGGRLV